MEAVAGIIEWTKTNDLFDWYCICLYLYGAIYLTGFLEKTVLVFIKKYGLDRDVF